jgi:CO/xanthine dehydrogenase FAD-binding subunit
MKAAVLGETGVEVRDVPKPSPKPNEVLIRVRASSLNRADLLVALGHQHGALGGVGPAPVRAREVEKAITGQVGSEALFREACESCRKIEAMSDVHAPADYRQHLAAVLSRRALEKAQTRVRKAG